MPTTLHISTTRVRVNVAFTLVMLCAAAVTSIGDFEDDDPPLKRTYVLEATEYGLQKMNELVNIQEPRLYKIGMWLEKDNPARYVAAFNSQSEEAKRLAKFGYASLQATSKLVQQLYSEVESRAPPQGLKLPTISLLHTALHDQCPLRGDQALSCPHSSTHYRTADGRCNNPAHPWWGASMMPLHRFLPSHYRDGLEKVRESVSGGPLPSARAVSTAIHSDRNSDLTSITHMVMQWGQFLDHDLTSSSQSRGFNGSVPKCCIDGGRDFQPADLTHPDCMAISVPPDDWFYSHYGVRCLEFVRSSPTSRVGCSLGPRDQINQVTSFIDASAVYGSSESEEDSVRMFRNGLLKYSRIQYRLPLLPAANYKADLCRGQAGHIRCFHAGDKRVNEQPGLIALHTIWLRAHNRIATELSHINPHWRDEKLYQETRRIIGALMQHITFKEFLPIVLGHDVMKLFDLELVKRGYYTEYDIKTNPTAANAFGTAAFRFGHSLVQHTLVRCDRSHNKLRSNVSLHEELTNPSNLYNIGSVDRLLLGLCQQPAQKRDEFITEELTNHLFQTPHYRYGMDLAALNIQRGRDHGLAPYTAWREPCGLQPFTDWPELLKVMSSETQRRLKRIYRDVDDIDLFPGAMAERPVAGGLVGPTFACILAQQFSNLRKGDRFWYENRGFESSFTLTQLQQIRRMTLARVLCDNLDGIDTLQPFVFLAADNNHNRRVPCDSDYIPSLDLRPWTEHKKEEIFHHEEQHAPIYQKPRPPSHHRPSTSHHRPPTKPLPSYEHTTKPSYEEHNPSYLIDFGTKPHEENKPSYLIDNQFQNKPTKPQNMYTTSKYPKPHEEHRPTYLIDEQFQESNRVTSKRPYGGYKPNNSAFLPVQHKEPEHNHHEGELPSKLETQQPEEQDHYYQHHHESTKPNNGYQPSHSKPHEEYPNHESVQESPNHHELHLQYPTHNQKPHDEYLSHSKPHFEHTSHSKPYYDHTSKPHYDHTTPSKPHYHTKPHYGHTTHSRPYYDYTTKPNYEHPPHSKPHYHYTTSNYKPQHDYTVSHTTISKPHHVHTSYTKPYDHVPSTLDYNKFKPRPSKTTSHYNSDYVFVTKHPHNEHQDLTNYSPVQRPHYQKPSTSGYHHTSYSYIKIFNEPSYYYLDDGQKLESVNKKKLESVNKNQTKGMPIPELHTGNLTNSYLNTDISSLELEPRTPVENVDIPANIDISNGKIVSFTSDTQKTANNASTDIVTIEGNIININAMSTENKKSTIRFNIIQETTVGTTDNTEVDIDKYYDNITTVKTTMINTSTNLDYIGSYNTGRPTSTNTPEISDLSDTMNNTNTSVIQNNNFNIFETNSTIDNFTSIRLNITEKPQVKTHNEKTDNTSTSTNDMDTILSTSFKPTQDNATDDMHLNTNTTNIFNNCTALNQCMNFSNTEKSKINYDMTTVNTTANINNKDSSAVSNLSTGITFTIVDTSTKQTDIVTDRTLEDVNADTNMNVSSNITNAGSESTSNITPVILNLITSDADYTGDWIFIEEEVDDDISFIPEMPILASDPLALKELPRPMIFDDEDAVSSRRIV